jgi:signal transduction histidine kinase
MRTSLRIRLILAFAFCILASFFIGFISSFVFVDHEKTLDYTSGLVTIDESARELVKQFNQINQNRTEFIKTLGRDDPAFKQKFLNRPVVAPKGNEEWLAVPSDEHSVYHLTNSELIQYLVDAPKQKNNLKVLVTDLDGKVLYKSVGASDTQVDIHHLIQNATMTHINEHYDQPFTTFYPTTLNGSKAFVLVSGIPTSTVVYVTEPGITPYFLAFITFMVCFYLITNGKMKEMEGIAAGLMEIARGNLKYRIKEKSKDELGTLSSNINYMAQELDQMIEKQRLTEKLKDELITNVSHDLRTPLTSIMGYMRLVKDHQYTNQNQLDEYVDIAYGKSEQLKTLIEDLFEFTRLTHEGIQLKKLKVSLHQMLEQLMDELEPIAKENHVEFQKDFLPERIRIEVDPNQMVRALENVLTNAIKYSLHPGKVRVTLMKKVNTVQIIISNTCDPLSADEINRLFERFYRVDSSRSSSKGGTGLGLAITKSIVELHHGSIDVDYQDHEIQFRIALPL